MSEAPPRPIRFGKYHLLKKIGVGGMAEVYKAVYAQGAEKPIAIKRILRDLSLDRKLASMLINEAKLAMTLKHPNIVELYDFGLVKGHYFIAMEFVDGVDVRMLLKKAYSENKTIPIDIIFYIAANLLEALSYAHSKRDNFNKPLEIIHRDISPQNLMISYDGEVKILDFGIAKAKGTNFEIAKAKGSITETQAGILKGKFSYMSPEQAKGKKLDQRSDLFSAGIVLYELLAVESLFGGASEAVIIDKVRRASIPDLTQKNQDVSKDLLKLVRKALSKKKWKRFQSAKEFKNELLLWGNKEGLLINQEYMREYILSEFPREEEAFEPLNVMDEISAVERSETRAKTASSTRAITSIEKSIEEIVGKAPDYQNSKETAIDTLSPLFNEESSHDSSFSYSVKNRLSSIFSIKTITVVSIIVLLFIALIKRDRIKIDIETTEKIYNLAVLKPRELVRKIRKTDQEKTSLDFDAKSILSSSPSIEFSPEAQKYLSKIPLLVTDEIHAGLNKILQSEKIQNPKECEGKAPYSCMIIGKHRILYKRKIPFAGLYIKSIF